MVLEDETADTCLAFDGVSLAFARPGKGRRVSKCGSKNYMVHGHIMTNKFTSTQVHIQSMDEENAFMRLLVNKSIIIHGEPLKTMQTLYYLRPNLFGCEIADACMAFAWYFQSN